MSGLGRDPVTGELLNKISIDVHLADQSSLMYTARDWKAARTYLASAEFRSIADQVDFVTLTNRES